MSLDVHHSKLTRQMILNRIEKTFFKKEAKPEMFLRGTGSILNDLKP
jgi:hypothetical protein